MKRDKTLFNLAGYSPLDGLGEGRWVPRPGSAGIVDWVGALEAANVKPEPVSGSCFDCQAVINHRATRCRSCAVRHRQKKAAA